MDPKILPEQSGLRTEAQLGEEGASYLRRLKTQTPDASPKTEEVSGIASLPRAKPASNWGPPIDWNERRRSPRYRCSGSAEFRVAGSTVHTWGTITDISLHGCYVEMNETHPPGTRVELILKSCGVRIEVSGTVRVSYPSLGMGICFDEVQAEGKKELEQLLTALSSNTVFTLGVKNPEVTLADTLRRADPRALRDELADFFGKNSLLSRDEFQQIAKRVRRA